MIRKVATNVTNAKLAYVRKAVPGADVAVAIGPLIGRVRTVMLSSLDGELQPFGMTGIAVRAPEESCRRLRCNVRGFVPADAL